MTHDEIIAVVQAHKEGRVIEDGFKDMEDADKSWRTNENPAWNFDLFDYRIKPEPKPPTLREWEPEEVPLDAWFKKIGFKIRWKVTGFDPSDKVHTVQLNGDWFSLKELREEYSHSFTPFDPDSWKECGVREEQS